MADEGPIGDNPTNERMVAAYADLRGRCLELGRSLSAEQADIMSPCCPEWSVKDLFAHMTGVPVDIIEGNIEDAATVAWADAHITRRADDSLAQICDEWEATAEQLDSLLGHMGTAMRPEFYIDAWTHEWDIRQALGDVGAATPDMRFAEFARDFLLDAYVKKAAASDQEISLKLVVTDGDATHERVLGDNPDCPTLTMTLFEMSRIAMGRRSEAQIRALGADIDPAFLVFWSPSDRDLVDPVIA